MTKPCLCKTCGETDPKKFYGSNKSICRKCSLVRDRERYVSKTIILTREEYRNAHKKSQKYFEETVIANHGDIYLFDRARYQGQKHDVEIGCKKHRNYFWIQGGTLLRRTERNGGKKKNPVVGSCPVCREEYFDGIKNEILDKCRAAHNNEYEYGEYVNIDTVMKVWCKTHGEFEVMPDTHSNGGAKCPVCCPIYPWGKKPNPRNKWVGDKRYYICEIHGDVAIGQNRAMTDGCPKCVEIKNKRVREEKLKIGIEKKFGSDYDIFLTEKYMEFRCKTHGTRTTYTRKELVKKSALAHHCSECRKFAEMLRLKVMRDELENRCKQTLVAKYSNFYQFIKFVGDKRVKLLNVLKNKKKVVLIKTVIDLQLSTNTRYLLRQYMSYEEARDKVRDLGITGFRQYKKWYVRTQQTGLPTNPQRYYKGSGWISYNDFFGNNFRDQMSMGEKRIADYLDRKEIGFEYQKRYDGCRDKNPLPFDFYVPDYNLIIEFDGYQHYFEVTKFETSLADVQRHDEMKNKYCSDNGINIIRIPFWELDENVVEWTLDIEITRIGAEQVVNQ